VINNLNFSKSQIVVLLILWSAFLFSFVDRLAWAPVIPLAAKALSLNAKEAGSYMSAFYFGYILTQLPGGYLADRFGYRKILLCSFFIMGFFTILMGTVSNFWQGFFYRIFAGMGSGAIFSACVKGIFDWFSEKNRYTAMGFFMTASSVGVFLVNIIVPTVAKFHGWNASFYAAGLLPIITLLFAYFFLRENSILNDTRSIASFVNDVKILLKNKEFMLTGLAGFFAMWATWGTATWANSYLNKGLGLTLVQAGFFMSAFGITALICKPIAGILTDITDWKKKNILFFMLILFFIFLVIFGINRSIFFLYFLAPILGILAFVYSPVMNTFVGELVDKRNIGVAMGLINAIWQLGSLISPLAVGFVLDLTHSYFYAFLTLGIGPLLGAIIMLSASNR